MRLYSEPPRVAVAALIGVLAVICLVLAACGDGRQRGGMDDVAAARLTGGVPERGRAAIAAYGCGTCHTVKGVPGARALVGPPLQGIAERAYIAGVLPNSPENLTRWIRHPRQVDSLTAMPEMGVTERDARDIAAYLYTLR